MQQVIEMVGMNNIYSNGSIEKLDIVEYDDYNYKSQWKQLKMIEGIEVK
jgi:hypothetical protein